MKKLELEQAPVAAITQKQGDRPTTNLVSARIPRPESQRLKNPNALRLSLVNFKFIKASELMNSPTNNPELSEKLSKPTCEKLVGSANHSRASKTPISNLNFNQKRIRFLRSNPNRIEKRVPETLPSSPTHRLEMVIGRSPVNQQSPQNRMTVNLPKRTFNNLETQKSTLVRTPTHQQKQQLRFSCLVNSNNFKKDLQQPAIVKEQKEDPFQQGFNEELEEPAENTQCSQTKQTPSISDTTKKGRIINFSMSLSSQNTLVVDSHTSYSKNKEEQKYMNFATGSSRSKPMLTTRSEPMRDLPSMHTHKTSKALDRIIEAKEKAMIYDDRMIKQFQFNREDEEEELNFLELCGALNSHV